MSGTRVAILVREVTVRFEINVLAFDVPADAKCGGIRSMSAAAGKPMGQRPADCRTRLTTGATIVTANVAEFKRIPGSACGELACLNTLCRARRDAAKDR
jgi:predicted nucleic acid-binding protein